MSYVIDDLVDGELKKWFRDFVDEVRKIRKLRKKMGSSSTSSVSVAGLGLTTPPSGAMRSQTVVPPLAGLGMLEVVGVHEDLLESTARPANGETTLARELAEIAKAENAAGMRNSDEFGPVPSIMIGDSEAPPPLICIDPSEEEGGHVAGNLILLVDASGKTINGNKSAGKNNNLGASPPSNIMSTTTSVLDATTTATSLAGTFSQLTKPLGTSKRTVSFLEGSRSEITGVLSPRSGGRESVGLETKLGSAIRDMSRKEIENSLEQAVRLIFELIKATNRSAQQQQQQPQPGPLSEPSSSRRTSLGLSGRKDSRLKMRSSLTKNANSNSGDFLPPSKASRSTTPRTFNASHSKADTDFHACVDDDFADFEDERTKARQARASLAAAQMAKMQQQLQQAHDDDSDSTNSSEGGGGVNHARATARLAVTESMDIDDLMGSQSLNETDVGAFVEHINLKREKDTKSGNIIINDYVVLGNLGQGAYGKVKLAHVRDDPTKLVAIKIINKSLTKKQGAFKQGAASESQIRREIAIMKKLRHRNIVSLHSVVDDPEAEKMYMVMDYIGGGTVLKDETNAAKKAEGFIYEPVAEQTAVNYLRQLVDGLRHMHKHGIAHRDVKPANILLNANRIYLSDFGVSELCDPEEDGNHAQPAKSPSFVAFNTSFNNRNSTETQQFTQREDQPFASTPNQRSSVSGDAPVSPMRVKGHKGTPLFWPPEMFSSDPESEGFHDGEMQDLWALGITLFMMLTGKAPFSATAFPALKKEVTSPEAVAIPDSLSHKARFLLKSMLNKDPNERPGLLDIRHHPFLGGYDKRTAVDRGSIFVYSTELDEEDAITVASGAVLPTKYLIAKVKPLVMRKIYRIRERKRLRALEEEKRASVDRSTSGHTGSNSNTDSNNSTTTAPAIGASTTSTAVMMSPGTDQLALTPKGDLTPHGRSPTNPGMSTKTLSNRSNPNNSFTNIPISSESTNQGLTAPNSGGASRAPIISESVNFPTPGDAQVVRPPGLILPTLHNIDVFVTQEVGPRRGSVQDSPDSTALANSQQNSVSGPMPAGVSMNPRRASIGPSPPNSQAMANNANPTGRPRKVSITDSTMNGTVGFPSVLAGSQQPLPILTNGTHNLYDGSRLMASNPYAGGSRVGFWRTGSSLNHTFANHSQGANNNNSIAHSEGPAIEGLPILLEQQPSPSIPHRAVSPMLPNGKGTSPASPMALRPPTPTSHGQRTALLQAEVSGANATQSTNLFQPRNPVNSLLTPSRLGAGASNGLLAAPSAGGAYGSFSVGARPAAIGGNSLYNNSGSSNLTVPSGGFLTNATRANSSLPGLLKPIGNSSSPNAHEPAAHFRKSEPLAASVNSLSNTQSLSPGSRVRNRLSNALMLNTTE